MGTNACLFKIHEGGRENAEVLKTLKTAINNTKISTPRNQIFVVFNTIGKNYANIRLNAAIIESK